MRRQGFSLIELMIAIAILAIVLTLGIPVYNEYMANTQVRNAAESILNGLRVAQAEAVKRNAPVVFVLDKAVGWQVQDPDTAAVIQKYVLAEGADKVALTGTPGTSTRVTFNGLGRNTANKDGSAPLTRIDLKPSLAGGTRELRVLIDISNIRLCDPKFPSTDPMGCP
jgi:type IV fimbrial biogenesis protein FimT